VPYYRVYPVNHAGRILGPSTVIECANDPEAIHEAQQAVDGHDVEIWQEARLVVRLSSDEANRSATHGRS
jgi:hypothetical protein